MPLTDESLTPWRDTAGCPHTKEGRHSISPSSAPSRSEHRLSADPIRPTRPLMRLGRPHDPRCPQPRQNRAPSARKASRAPLRPRRPRRAPGALARTVRPHRRRARQRALDSAPAHDPAARAFPPSGRLRRRRRPGRGSPGLSGRAAPEVARRFAGQGAQCDGRRARAGRERRDDHRHRRPGTRRRVLAPGAGDGSCENGRPLPRHRAARIRTARPRPHAQSVLAGAGRPALGSRAGRRTRARVRGARRRGGPRPRRPADGTDRRPAAAGAAPRHDSPRSRPSRAQRRSLATRGGHAVEQRTSSIRSTGCSEVTAHPCDFSSEHSASAAPCRCAKRRPLEAATCSAPPRTTGSSRGPGAR